MTTYVRRRPKSLVPRVIHGDATDLVLRDSSVDAVVTDPPYLLGFMGKQWDSRKAHEHLDWHGQWCAEALRVLKPGGYMLAFGGTRTWHRLMCAVEDAGFEVRDSIAWLYGNGFPKSNGVLKPAFEPIIVARKLPEGTVANNVAVFGTGNMNVDVCRTDYLSEDDRLSAVPQGRATSRSYTAGLGTSDEVRKDFEVKETSGRWPTNVLLDECQAADLDEQSGVSISVAGSPRSGVNGTGWGMTNTGAEYNDSGGASRFFPTFKWQAKAPPKERPKGEDGLQHPTVKPLELMRWLVRLVTPPGGTVLDMFAGSGTTLEAARLEGFSSIGVENHEPYLELIQQRLSR